MKTGMDWDDIVFEKRNREYGAYQFRKNYSRSVVTGMLTALFVLMAICSYPMISNLLDGNKPKTVAPKHVENIILLPMPPIDIDVVTPKINSPALKEIIKSVAPKVTALDVEDDKIPDIEQLRQADDIGPVSQAGLGDVTLEMPVKMPDSVGKVDNKIHLFVEQQPEYPGGEAALMKYLNQNIHYPSSARRMGIEGRVTVQFVINKEGEVDNVQVLRGLSGDCDNEAMRVLKLMPKWKPGKQGGRPVKVQLSVPVNYRLE